MTEIDSPWRRYSLIIFFSPSLLALASLSILSLPHWPLLCCWSRLWGICKNLLRYFIIQQRHGTFGSAITSCFIRLCPVLQVQASHFEGLITTIVGYILLAMTLILCHVSLCLHDGMNVAHTLQACRYVDCLLLEMLKLCRSLTVVSGTSCSGQVSALSASSGSVLHCCQGMFPPQLRLEQLELKKLKGCMVLIPGLSAGCRGDWRFPTYLWLVARHLFFSKTLPLFLADRAIRSLLTSTFEASDFLRRLEI